MALSLLLALQLSFADNLDWVQPTGEINVGEKFVRAVAASPDGELVAIIGGALSRVSVLRWTDKTLVTRLATSDTWDAIAFSADSRRIFVTSGASRKGGGIAGAARLAEFSSQTGESLNERTWLHEGIECAATLPDNRLLAIATRNGEVALVRTSDLEKERFVRHSVKPAFALHCSPDGKRIASSGGGQVSLIEIRDGGQLVIAETFSGNCCAFSPDSKRIAVWRDLRAGERGIQKIEIRTTDGTIESILDSNERAYDIAWLRAERGRDAITGAERHLRLGH